jgi:integrase
MDELERHMSTYCGDDPNELVFTTRSHKVAYGAAQTAITRTMRRMGIRDFRVHDLRHTGQDFAARNGATVADLKSRLGHSTWNAAMHYAHASSDNDRKIADKMADQRTSVVHARNTKQARKRPAI